MAIRNPADLKALAATGRRLMGLDIGSKTIGLALSDTRHKLATPLETIKRTKFTADAARLRALIAAHGVGALVVGLPVGMDGGEGPRCQSVRQFAASLLETIDIPIAFWDERLSTAAVTRGMIEADLTRKRRAAIVDRAAAAYILQGLLDYLGHLPPPAQPPVSFTDS
jgi:putative Holliday junction resolvase